MAEALEEQLAEIDQQKDVILGKIKERDRAKEIGCESCNESHKIKNLTLIQTHHYVPPHGCTEGAYWKESEMQFICPKTEVRNRLLFDNNDVPWKDREKYENNPEAQFKTNYRSLFREVVNDYNELDGPTANNFYVDENREKFGLVEKR